MNMGNTSSQLGERHPPHPTLMLRAQDLKTSPPACDHGVSTGHGGMDAGPSPAPGLASPPAQQPVCYWQLRVWTSFPPTQDLPTHPSPSLCFHHIPLCCGRNSGFRRESELLGSLPVPTLSLRVPVPRPGIESLLQGLQLGQGDRQRSLPRSGHLPPSTTPHPATQELCPLQPAC